MIRKKKNPPHISSSVFNKIKILFVYAIGKGNKSVKVLKMKF